MRKAFFIGQVYWPPNLPRAVAGQGVPRYGYAPWRPSKDGRGRSHKSRTPGDPAAAFLLLRLRAPAGWWAAGAGPQKNSLWPF